MQKANKQEAALFMGDGFLFVCLGVKRYYRMGEAVCGAGSFDIFRILIFSNRLYICTLGGVFQMASTPLAKMIDDHVCISSEAVLRTFAISRTTLSNWEKSGLSKVKFGWWAVDDLVEFKIKQVRGATNEQEMGDKDRKLRYEAELKEAQAQAQRFKNDVACGEYLERAIVIREGQRLMSGFRQAALALGAAVATALEPSLGDETALGVESMVNEIMRNALVQFSEADL